MERFSYLIKSKNKALAVFEKAKKNLLDLQAQIEAEIDAANGKILSMYDKIEEEKKAVIFLNQHHEATRQTAAKIDAILS